MPRFLEPHDNHPTAAEQRDELRRKAHALDMARLERARDALGRAYDRLNEASGDDIPAACFDSAMLAAAVEVGLRDIGMAALMLPARDPLKLIMEHITQPAGAPYASGYDPHAARRAGGQS